ncbi:aldo/keto reductase [Galbibacter mesophilus]|uniref:aldo/keto reductase n=1 Tax=Galbibacter mesophilus TaxID=379069 RepID=UPI00191FECBE|nr:aldo/keto reductase [Galbibacter mesophilus]MCM5663853.1 aldo/keto reductase [Galbibacter mesophilus]
MRIGLGTAALGRPLYINVKQEKTAVSDLNAFKMKGIQVLDAAYEMGVRFFDTAPGYGLAENLLLEWLKSKNDTTVEVSTKWGYTYVANFDPNAKVHEVKEHSLHKLNEQWEYSKGLQPNLKLYQIHSATLETGVLSNDKILAKLFELKKEQNLEIGATTSGHNQVEIIKKALDVSVEREQLFDSFQITYNILEQDVIKLCNELSLQEKKILVKEALANGRIFKNNAYPHYKEMYAYLSFLADKYQVGEDAIALRFCMQTIPKSLVLSGASNISHLEANLKANDIVLSKEEINRLKEFKISSSNYWEERKKLTWQ